MNDTVIRIEHLSKRYRLGVITASSLGDDLRQLVRRMRGGKTAFPAGEDKNELWALRDVSFDVQKGEVLGIVGKNGAGKSTLLKILSRVTAPSSGTISIRGRVASLLEVGTGFHPELTGRENVFLNGAILGMTRAEIRRQFDEIVDFAGVEKFIDTPVKRYSSGMYVRLAFAVAAHLEPEILIVDEVLAVGDADFQKKCLGKMKSASTAEGRTVLFVSHNMPAVKSLCTKAVMLKNGALELHGSVHEVVNRYFAKEAGMKGIVEDAYRTANSGEAKYLRIELLGADDKTIDEVYYGAPMRIRLHFEAAAELKGLLFDVKACTSDGMVITHTYNTVDDRAAWTFSPGGHVCEVTMDNHLQPGKYSLTVGMHHLNFNTIDYVENIYDFTILDIAKPEEKDKPYTFFHGFVKAGSRWARLS